MSGLFLLGVLITWAVFVVYFVRWLARRVKPGVVRNLVMVFASIILLALPVADELISAPQFYKLCEDEAKLKFDPEKIRDKTIIYEKTFIQNPRLTVGFLHGYYIQRWYLDATTGEKLISETSYHLKGGILIRTLGISETNAPLTTQSYCGSQEHPTQKNFLDRYGLKYIEVN